MSNLYDAARLSSFRKLLSDELTFIEYTCDPGGPMQDIWSHHGYFTYVVRGEMIFQCKDQSFTIKAGHAYFVRRGAYNIPPVREEFCDLVIFIPDNLMCRIIAKYQLLINSNRLDSDYPLVMPLHIDDGLQSYYQSLFSYFLGTKSPSVSLLKIKLEEFIVNVLENKKNQALIAYCRDLMTASKVDLRSIMEDNFNNHLDISDFARMSARSLATFRRDFKSCFGIPPGDWLRKKRLDYSKHLLATSDKTVEEVVFEAGFKNRSHFSRIFKNKFGISPSHFRKLK